LLALKANRRVCSISNPFGLSKMTLALLPCWLEDPSTEKTHLKSIPSWCVATEESSRFPVEPNVTQKRQWYIGKRKIPWHGAHGRPHGNKGVERI